MASKKSAETLVSEQTETAPVQAADDAIEATGKATEIVVGEVIPVPAFDVVSVRAMNGDNYLTIAEKHGLDPQELSAINNGAPVITGMKVFIK